jgi:hypothetical protein
MNKLKREKDRGQDQYSRKSKIIEEGTKDESLTVVWIIVDYQQQEKPQQYSKFYLFHQKITKRPFTLSCLQSDARMFQIAQTQDT